jgi:hypothetical protein
MEVSGQLEGADRFTVWYRVPVPTVSETVCTPDRSEQTGGEVRFLLLPREVPYRCCTPLKLITTLTFITWLPLPIALVVLNVNLKISF